MENYFPKIGDWMRNYSTLKKLSKGFISLLLVLTVMVGLFVPFNLSVLAEEEAATGSDIYAMLYYVDPSKKATDGSTDVTKNLELVFQRGDVVDSEKTLCHEPFSNFDGLTKKDTLWKDYRSNIVKVDVINKIAPTTMTGWFYRMNNLYSENLLHLENIDTKNVTNMAFLFESSNKLTYLDLHTFDVSKVTTMQEAFCSCSALKNIDISTF